MPKDTSRPSLPTSSSDFALHLHSSPGASGSSVTLDDPNYLVNKWKRPSLLSSRIHSPLASSFTVHTRRRSLSVLAYEESESEKEGGMSTDSPSSSEHATPPLGGPPTVDDEPVTARPKPRPPSTPPRRRSSAASMDADMPTVFNRRLAFPLKQPRILKILSEPKPDENEFRSEAAFQRLIHSTSELPRTPRPLLDRGRYPEEAGNDDEPQREETPSDDELDLDEPFAFNTPGSSQPINIVRNGRRPTPAGSVNGDDFMSVSEPSSLTSTSMMDIDPMPSSPSYSSFAHAHANSWRYTPPPTASNAHRSNKRKADDRFDPYPSASKRRAVSPSLHHLRDNMSVMSSPMGTPFNRGRQFPMAIPITIPTSAMSSAASSPTITSSAYSQYPRFPSTTSSPTMRSAPLLASPIIRPIIPKPRRHEGEEREVAGAGEAVNGLTLEERSIPSSRS